MFLVQKKSPLPKHEMFTIKTVNTKNKKKVAKQQTKLSRIGQLFESMNFVWFCLSSLYIIVVYSNLFFLLSWLEGIHRQSEHFVFEKYRFRFQL